MENFIKTSVIIILTTLATCALFLLGTVSSLKVTTFMENLFIFTLIGLGILTVIITIYEIVLYQVRKENRKRRKINQL